MDKPKPQKLKSDVELTTGNDPESAAAPLVVASEASTKKTEAVAIAEPTSAVKVAATQQAVKKRAEDIAFLAAYNQRQNKRRIQFVAISALILSIFWCGIWMTLNASERARGALIQLPMIFGTAFLGDKDLSSYQLSQLWYPDAETDAKTIDARTSILDKSIADLQAVGKPSIFSRLGAQTMLMQNGQRAKGLAYGQYLIDKYPDLPSNYFARAKADFNQANFPDAIKEYGEAVALLSRLPEKVGRAWCSELPKAAWACIDSGRMAEAARFIDAYVKYDGYRVQALTMRAQIPLSMVESLAMSDLRQTPYWNATLAAYSEKLLARSTKIGNVLARTRRLDQDPSELRTILSPEEELMFAISLQTADATEARKIVDENRLYKYYWAPLAAQLAIHDHKPQAALDALNSMRKQLVSPQQSLLKAQAYEQMGAWPTALDQADQGIAQYRHDEAFTGRYFLPLHLTKGRLLFDMKSYDRALAESDLVSRFNPHLIEARLLKIHCLEALKKTQLVSIEEQKLRDELNSFASEVGQEQEHE